MTHLSDFSYLSRLMINCFLLGFVSYYCFIFSECMRDMTKQNLQKQNFKAVIVFFYIVYYCACIVSDALTTSVKYKEGFYDSCKLDNCFWTNSSSNNASDIWVCEYVMNLEDCIGIITRPEALFTSKTSLTNMDIADTFWNIACASRISALFLFIANFNISFNHIFSVPIMNSLQVKLLAIASVVSLITYLVLQFSLEDILHVVWPQIIYSVEIFVCAVFILITNFRIDHILHRLPRNYEQPKEHELTLMYFRVLNYCLFILLLMESIALLFISTDILVWWYGNGQGFILTDKFLTDLFTSIFNVGFVLSPLFAIAIVYKPKFKFFVQHSNRNSKISVGVGDVDIMTPVQNTDYVQPVDDVNKQAAILNSIADINKIYSLKELGMKDEPETETELDDDDDGDDISDNDSSLSDNPVIQKITGDLKVLSKDFANTPPIAKTKTNPEDVIVEMTELTRHLDIINSASMSVVSPGEQSIQTLKDINDLGSTSSTTVLNRHLSKVIDTELSIVESSDVTDGGDADRESPTQKQLKVDVPSVDDSRFWQASKTLRSSVHMRTKTQELADGELSMDERMQLSKIWLLDAIHNRAPKLHRIKPSHLRTYTILHGFYWRALVICCIVVQLIVIPWWEPVATLNHDSKLSNKAPLVRDATFDVGEYKIAVGFDFLCCIVENVDWFFELYTYGIRALQLVEFKKYGVFYKRSYQSIVFIIHVAICVTMLLNVFAALIWVEVFRFDRFLRPLLLGIVYMPVRDLIADLIITFRGFLGVVFIYLMVIVVYGILGTHILDYQQYALLRDKFFGNSSDTVEHYFTLENTPELALNLFTLSSMENFPSIFWPAYRIDSNEQRHIFSVLIASLYYFSYIFISIMILQSIAVPSVYDPFKLRQRNRILRAKFNQRKAMVASFEILDVNGEYELSQDIIINLFHSFGNKVHDAELMLQLLDQDFSGTIDLLEYFKIVDTIKLRVKLKEDDEVGPYIFLCGQTFLRKNIEKFINSSTFKNIGHILTFVLFFLLCGNRLIDDDVIAAAIGIFSVWTLFEMTLFMSAKSFKVYWNASNFNKILTVYTIAIAILYIIYLSLTGGKDVMLDVIQVLCIPYIFRFLSLTRTASTIVFVTSKMMNMIGNVVLVLLIIVYFYMMVGMESFSSTLLTSKPYNSGDFASILDSFVTVISMAAGESWDVFMYIQFSFHKTSMDRVMIVFYFVSYQLLVNMYILSIVLAVFLDAFLVYKDQKEDIVQEVTMPDKAARFLGVGAKKYIMTLPRSLEETLYMDYIRENNKIMLKSMYKQGIISKQALRILNRNKQNHAAVDKDNLLRKELSSSLLMFTSSSALNVQGGNDVTRKSSLLSESINFLKRIESSKSLSAGDLLIKSELQSPTSGEWESSQVIPRSSLRRKGSNEDSKDTGIRTIHRKTVQMDDESTSRRTIRRVTIAAGEEQKIRKISRKSAEDKTKSNLDVSEENMDQLMFN